MDGSFRADKSLGQHWLRDEIVLQQIASHAQLSQSDTVLEIGPGLGTLTQVLSRQSGGVIAVEFDPKLATSLQKQHIKNTEIINADFLHFDLETLPQGYKVVANVPYYITSKIIERLLTSDNKPSLTVLLVQKEVAQRLAAVGGKHSILSISAQLFADVRLGDVVPAEMFFPPPKVDSQVVIFQPHEKPLFENFDEARFFRVVKAGFSEKRKKLMSSLAGGLGIEKEAAKSLLESAGIDPNQRAENISLQEWWELAQEVKDDN
ncbi:MAG: 16S rRNA (adenine(1518)-N(6)/adenine(1519)-N(6))-dimethyltransferase RsmA [Patescibacteria group bacterium]